MTTQSHMLLEEIRATILHQYKPSSKSQKKFIHIHSRASPYVYTHDARFPVTEKFVPWEIPFELYDPTLITLPKEHSCFSNNDRPFVELNSSDQSNVSVNPVGRTGVRGRGALIRWGANKSIMAIITRWKKLDNEFVTVEGKQVLEVMIFTDTNTNDYTFAQAKMMGTESPYGALCRDFSRLAFQEDHSEYSSSFQEQNMIKFFESFAYSAASEFESHMIHRGYIDDVRNTDNAWVETEIWNFHYVSTSLFPQLRVDGSVVWQNVTHNLRYIPIQTSILRSIARIHNAYFE